MLAAGLAVGLVAAVVIVRSSPEAVGTATVQVNSSPLPGDASNAEKVAQQLAPAVGTIVARQGQQNGLGSGFVIGHDSTHSYLVTNNHVVSASKDLHVIMPAGRNLAATVVGTDALDDLAVVSVPDAGLPVATWGPSSQLRVGQTVIAIGSPLGNEGSVTQGVVSALHRTISAGEQGGASAETLQDVLQTDASINRGNSGGPLADAGGRVVGVNVAIAGGASNIGFSIPSDLAQRVAQQLMARQKVDHPYIGILYLSNTDATEAGHGFDGPGVLVTDVKSDSPGAKAGFQKNDILVAVDGVPIDNGQTLGGLIQTKKVGAAVTFTVRRGSSTTTLSATLSERPGS
jgi:putative serine protease PepD